MESLFGSSLSGAATEAAGSAASSSLADFAASSAADTAATTAADTGLTAAGTTAFDTTGGSALGGTGEFATGVTAGDLATTGAGTGATLAAPSFLDQVTSAYNSVSPYIDTAGKILQTGNMLKNAISGAGTPATGSANTPSPAPATVSTPASQNQMTRDDYIKQQEACWQNLLAAQGNSLPGNQLPPNIQDAIRRQASIYPA